MEVTPLSEICRMTAGTLRGALHPDPEIRQVLTDSRRLLLAEGTLFVALKTSKNDGHEYIGPLARKGVKSFLVSQLPDDHAAQFPEATFVVVPDTLAALQQLAAQHRRKYSLTVVAITGSNGKTIIKEWLFQLLTGHQHIVRNPRSYNSQIGVPLSVLQITASHELGIFEAGISRPGEMHTLQQIIRPHIGIFTNIGPAHDEGFASTHQKIAEKLRLFVHCQGLIYCADHQVLAGQIALWHHDHPGVQLLGWSRHPGTSLQVLATESESAGTRISLLFRQQTHTFVIPFTDQASIENAIHCMAFLFFSGHERLPLHERMQQLQPVAMRLEMKEGINHSLIINDSYNSDLNSLSIALDFLKAQSRYDKSTLILSDILQSGMVAGELYGKVATLVAAHGIGRLIGIGPRVTSQRALFPSTALFFPDVEAFIHDFDFRQIGHEGVLLKGARVFGFERISTLLQHKDHQTILEINLDALVNNLNIFRSLVRPSTKVMAMVKAFSYGSGSVEIASLLQYHQVDYLAVAYADEGRELRQGGIHLPIVVMNPEVRSFDILFDYNLQPEVYSLGLLRRLADALEAHSGENLELPFPIHLKLDTGMHRLGFLEEETHAMIHILRSHPRIRVASVFSHLAASDDPAHDEFTRQQITRFEQWCHTLRQALGYNFIRHLANTSAISRFPEAHFEMVRPGVGLYGVSADAPIQRVLQQVSTFRTVISQVKQVRKGQTVGYSRAATAPHDMTIAILPVGYADGLNRRLGEGRGHLLVGGRLVPLVGRISMDMCAVEVTGMQVREGDQAIIFGPERPVQQLANELQTIPYEVFTSVSQRVKRIYFQE